MRKVLSGSFKEVSGLSQISPGFPFSFMFGEMPMKMDNEQLRASLRANPERGWRTLESVSELNLI